jgi:hypothetical protein
VDAGVDDFGIARTRFGADRVRRFEDQRFETPRRQCARDRQANHAGARDDAINLFHALVLLPFCISPPRRGCWRYRSQPCGSCGQPAR